MTKEYQDFKDQFILELLVEVNFDDEESLQLTLSREWLKALDQYKNRLSNDYLETIQIFIQKKLSSEVLKKTITPGSVEGQFTTLAIAVLQILIKRTEQNPDFSSLFIELNSSKQRNKSIRELCYKSNSYLNKQKLVVHGGKVGKLEKIRAELSRREKALIPIKYEASKDYPNRFKIYREKKSKLPKLTDILIRAINYGIDDSSLYRSIYSSIDHKSSVVSAWDDLSEFFLTVNDYSELSYESRKCFLDWLYTNIRFIDLTDKRLLTIAKNIYQVPVAPPKLLCPINRAINTEQGKITQIILEWWFQISRARGTELSSEMKAILNQALQLEEKKDFLAITTSYTRLLYNCDEVWTKESILPYFSLKNLDNQNSDQINAWCGLLYSISLTQDLAKLIAEPFAGLSQHLSSLDFPDQLINYKKSYASLFAMMFFDVTDVFTSRNKTIIKDNLINNNLLEYSNQMALQRICKELYKDNHWTNIEPYLNSIIPNDGSLAGQHRTIETLAKICLVSEDYFDKAFQILGRHFLNSNIPKIGHLLEEKELFSDIIKNSPGNFLIMLYYLLYKNCKSDHRPETLSSILSEIKKSRPSLAKGYRFLRLSAL